MFRDKKDVSVSPQSGLWNSASFRPSISIISPALSVCNFLSGKKKIISNRSDQAGTVDNRTPKPPQCSKTCMNLCRECQVVRVFLSGGQSLDPGCRSADSVCSGALVSGAAVPDRPGAEERCLAWLPCCGRTPEPDRCDSYRLDKSDKRLPVKINTK